MKIKLISILVMTACSTYAWADASSVQLYGVIDVGITHFTGLAPSGGAPGQTASSTGLSSGVQTGDLLGVKGTEDLGGGLSAIFDVETGFCGVGTNQDGSVGQSSPNQDYCTGGGFMQRLTWAGLKGNFGELTAGRMYSMALINEATADPFGWGLTGSNGNLSLTGDGGGYNILRTSQTLQYQTPSFAGFDAIGSYSFAPTNGGTVPTAGAAGSQVPRLWSLDGEYASGPVTAGVYYSRMSNEPYGLSASGVHDGTITLWQAYGAYDFGVAKLSALYEKAGGSYAYGTTSGAPAGSNTYWLIGATVPVGAGSLLASYGEGKANANSVLQPENVQGTAKQYAIGYTYSLSKQVNLYASYAHIINSANTAFAVLSGTDYFAGVAGQSSSGAAFGMRYSF